MSTMPLSLKQKAIIDFAKSNNNQITLLQATEITGSNIYFNAAKYTSELCSRMVKRGLLLRISKGCFVLSSPEKGLAKEREATGQMGLF